MDDHNGRPDILEDIFRHKSARKETATEEVFLRMKCPRCGTSNLVPVNRTTYSQKTLETSTKPVNLYEPKETAKCKKCHTIIAQLQELILLKQ
jgi:phage FluMu protein Com